MARTLSQRLRREFGRIFQGNEAPPIPKDSSDDTWSKEREYWLNALKEFYASNFGLEFHPAQSDSSIVPPAEKVAAIQRPEKAHPDIFFATGYRNVLDYQTELRDHGASVDRMENILEMGVGLGRLIVHYLPFKANLYGCDVMAEALDWTRAKLPSRVQLELTGLEPPLPYADSKFDFVYANSVFTHVPCRLVDAWAAELRRIVRPGGFLIFSVFDANHYFRDMSYRDYHRKFAAAGCCDWDHERGVHMTTYLSRDYIHAVWGRHFRLLEIRHHYRDQSHVVCRREA
jgi:SAM-dependent methyltransferase